MYAKNKGVYNLTPANDLLYTVLVVPEYTEELALTLNGKKRKIRKSDFETAMVKSGLPEKTIENVFNKFIMTRGSLWILLTSHF